MITNADWSAIILTFKLAFTVTVILLVIGVPIAWWLSRSTSIFKPFWSALIAMPLVLPPTVIGFYLLVFMGPHGAIGEFTHWLGLDYLPFTFAGLVVASIIYSLPFVVQPIHNAFQAMGERPLEVAATLGASPIDVFFNVALPLAKPGIIVGAVLGFAHTIGEFGIVLMIGGNIPGETQVLSVLLYDHVEALEYTRAHWLAGGLMLFSLVVLGFLFALNQKAFWNRNNARPSNEQI